MINSIRNFNINNNDNNKWISEIITKDVIDSWERGSTIRIKAKAGQGKTYWVHNTLYKEASGKILYVAHRKALMNDFKEELNDKDIDITSYQALIKLYENNVDVAKNLSRGYEYIIYDEFHYMFLDSSFNSSTEVNYNIMKDINKIKSGAKQIFISANDVPEIFNFNYKYFIGEPRTYGISKHVNDAYIISKNKEVEYIIEDVIDKNEKAIVFINNNKRLKELLDKYEDNAELYVSDSNELLKYMDEDAKDYIAKNNSFRKNILLSTSSLDAGVSIKDKKVKTIIIDNRQISQIYQMFNRRRFEDDNDKVDLFLLDYSNKKMGGYYTQYQEKIGIIEEYKRSKIDFLLKHGRAVLDNQLFYVDEEGNVQINEIRERSIYEEYQEVLDIIGFGFREYINFRMGIRALDLTIIKENETLEDKLRKLKGEVFLELKDRKPLIELINARQDGRYLRSLKTLNAVLDERGIPFTIEKFETSRSINGKIKKYKSAWRIVEKE